MRIRFARRADLILIDHLTALDPDVITRTTGARTRAVVLSRPDLAETDPDDQDDRQTDWLSRIHLLLNTN